MSGISSLGYVIPFFLLCGAVSGAVSDLPPRSPQSLPPTDPASAAWPAAAAGSPAAPNTATSSERFPAPAHTPGLPAVRSSPQHKPLAERVHIAPLCTSLRYPTKRSSWDRFLRQISGGLFLLRQGPPLSRRSWPSFSPARTRSEGSLCAFSLLGCPRRRSYAWVYFSGLFSGERSRTQVPGTRPVRVLLPRPRP